MPEFSSPKPYANLTLAAPRLLRAWSDALGLWRLCGRSKCLRGASCRGNGDDCIKRCLPLLPAKVQDWFEARYECERDGVPWIGVTTIEEEDALAAWQDAIRQSLPRRREAVPGLHERQASPIRHPAEAE